MTATAAVETPKMEKNASKEEKQQPNQGNTEQYFADSEEWMNSENDPEQTNLKNVNNSCQPGNGQLRKKEMSSKPHRQLCRSPCLDHPSFSQSSILQDGKLDMEKDYQAKMDFALKLGYAEEQIQSVLNKLGPESLINDVLAELVRLGNKGDSEGQVNLSLLMPCGPNSTEIVSPELSLEDKIDNSDNLRPVVIDGSNVAMRFMPPDDPLGRHGPSLENFLRKRPIVPEHKKQPCPYGKKCTYGHKCKYYHPERANQPQRSVADELRISAKLSTVKTMSENTLAKCGKGMSSAKGEIFSEIKRVTPKRQSDPSIRSVAVEPEEWLSISRKHEASSVPSLVTALSVPTIPLPKSHAVGALNTRSASSPVPGSSHFPHQKASLEHMTSMQYPPILVTNSHGTPISYAEQYPKFESMGDHGCYSVLGDFSKMNISSIHNREYYMAEADRGVYARNPNLCSDSRMSHTRNDNYSSYNNLYLAVAEAHPEGSLKLHRSASQNRLQPFPHSYHEALTRVQSYSPEDSKQVPHKQSVPHLALHAQHPATGARSSCPGDYPMPPNIHPGATPQPGRALVMTRMDSISDSRLYESNPMRHRRPPLCREQHASWDPLPCATDSYSYHSYPLSNSFMQPCYEPVMVRSVPEKMEQLWRNPWVGMCNDSREHVIPEHQYQTYKNLCNIFPSNIVLAVMEKNPHTVDAQQLAALIVAKLRAAR
ncbi:putative ribonuclease ZC3H12B [Tupaia chinensis]|uniref:Putative ribonuclease ZC3H12B n=1 Tax=Tupaia chinensis TaxID=246437 RepID=L8YGS0_TUPCH|nr:putative ribonuclease ZC3H12B [Tupaia chinensis]